MIRRSAVLSILAVLTALALAAPAGAIGPPCAAEFKSECFGLESLSASLSTTQAGAHPDFTYSFGLTQDPETKADAKGTHNVYSPLRNVRFEAPPGLLGEPNVLGPPQQCTAQELAEVIGADVGCPNGSQIGIAELDIYNFNKPVKEPIYMMVPPGGDVVARIGFVAFVLPIYADLKLRSESDYGLTGEVTDAATLANVVGSKITLWGVPSAKSHDTERCTPGEVFALACAQSPPRPPGSVELPFLTNPTRCGVSLSFTVAAASWSEPDRFDSKSASFPQITGCNKLPFGPDLTVEPTSHQAGAPTGADVTIRLPASEGVEVLEPSQIKDVKVTLPEGMSFNPGAADGLATCSAAQVRLGTREDSHCPDAAKMADTEFDIPALERNVKGAIYLREPEPGNLFRLWITADDLGLHVKLPGQLEVDKTTGQITEVTLDIPQAPIREAKLEFKSGLRAPLLNPPACGEYRTTYEFVPQAGGPPLKSSTPMQINEGCDTGGFAPTFSGGTTEPAAGQHSPFVFTLNRADGEQNPSSLEVKLPPGLTATFAGVPRCEGADAVSGNCPASTRIGKVNVAAGAGAFPLWAPQPGKDPTAVYLGGPYKGGPFSVIAVVPAQAGPFDLGTQVVRSALYVDPKTAGGSVKSDPFPQIIEGIPIPYRTIQVNVDRPGFTLNPTGCNRKQIGATINSVKGAVANLTAPFQVANCANLAFKPNLSFSLIGGTKRGAHPAMHAVVRPREGDANIAETVVRLPRSAFLDQAHIRTICTRVQFAANQCPEGSVYGHVMATSPLLDSPLEGPVYLRSSDHNLPDLVFALHGLVDIEAVGRLDSKDGGIRASFEGIPDAPLTEVVLDMQGGNKGLIVNSRNLCQKPSKATAELKAQNGRELTVKPLVKAKCPKRVHRKHKAKRH